MPIPTMNEMADSKGIRYLGSSEITKRMLFDINGML